MSLRNFYRWSFVLPIAVPIIVLAATPDASGWTTRLRFVLRYSLMAGGLPYLLFAAASLWNLRDQSASAHGRFLLAAPLVFAAWLFVLAIGWEYFVDGQSRIEWLLRTGTLFACGSIALGYIYTGLVHLIRLVLQKLEWVSRSAS